MGLTALAPGIRVQMDARRTGPVGQQLGEALGERLTRVARTLLLALFTILAVTVALAVFTSGAASLLDPWNFLLLLLGGLALLGLQWLRRGRREQAVWLIVVGTLLVLVVQTVRMGVIEPSTPHLFGYSVPMVFAALLLGRRGLVAALLASVTAVGTVFFLEDTGSPYVGVVRSSSYAGSIVAFALVMGLLALVLERFGAELRNAHRLAIERDAELVALVERLEGEIEEREAAERQREAHLESERAARAEAELLAGENERLLVEIRGLNEDLERSVEQRTAELREALEELEAFANTAAHDLRRPLRGIDGYAQMLEAEYGHRLDDDARHYLNRIRAGASLQGRLIEELLTLTRLVRSDLHVQLVDLSGLAGQIVAELVAGEPDRPVQVNIEPGMVAVGDERLLATLLANLIGNAWKFSSDSDPAKIEVGRQERDGHTVYYVADNGVGFDMHYYDKLFRPFQRLHAPDRFPGSGMGAAIAERIVRRHRGTIWAEAKPGSGATFYFILGTGDP